METEKYTFQSETDGLEISVLEVPAKGQPKAIVQIVHGMCEYKERYMDFMSFLAEQGYQCVIHDHRGHGESVRDENDLGYMYEGGCRGLVEDVRTLQLKMKEKFPGIPCFLIGHSMGSLIVRCYAKQYDADIDKLVVVGSPSKLPGMKAGLMLAGAAGKIKGSKGHSKLLDYMVMDMTYEKPFKNENLKHAWVNSDRDAVIRYNNDPKCNYKFSVNGYQGLIKTTINTYDKKGWKLENADLPVAFFSGADDPCAVSRKAFEESADLMRRIGYRNVTAHMYEGMRHEILNEPEHEKVYQDILDFLRK